MPGQSFTFIESEWFLLFLQASLFRGVKIYVDKWISSVKSSESLLAEAKKVKLHLICIFALMSHEANVTAKLVLWI